MSPVATADADALRALYHHIVVEHGKRPRNRGRPTATTSSAERENAVCGDCLTLHLGLANGHVASAGFEGAGCAVSLASASLLTETVRGLDVATATALAAAFFVLTGEQPASALEADQLRRSQGTLQSSALATLGELDCFRGVRAFPVRIGCATLPWHALLDALALDHAPHS